jgi:hypothetical protein
MIECYREVSCELERKEFSTRMQYCRCHKKAAESASEAIEEDSPRVTDCEFGSRCIAGISTNSYRMALNPQNMKDILQTASMRENGKPGGITHTSPTR